MKRIVILVMLMGTLFTGSLLMRCSTVHHKNRTVSLKQVATDTVRDAKGNILYTKVHREKEQRQEIYLYSTLGLLILTVLVILYGKK